MALFTEESVLVRTSEGEAAARQPRRVASNRARAALLLLDGQLSVGEMKRRFGDSLEVEDALMELLRDGLAVDRDDAVTDAEDELPVHDDVLQPEEPPTEMPPDPVLSIPPGFVVAGRPAPATTRPAPAEEPETELPPDRLLEDPSRIDPAADIDESITAAYADEPPRKKPKRDKKVRKRDHEPSLLVVLADRLRFHLTNAARGAVTLALAALIGLALIALWNSPEWFRAEIEARARAVAGAEVRIAHLAPAWSDGPALRLAGVSVPHEGTELAIEQLEFAPDWYALGRNARFGLKAHMKGLEGRPTELAGLLNRADLAQAGVLRIVFEDLRLRLTDQLRVALHGEGEVDDGVLQKLVLSSEGKGVEFRLPVPLSFPIEFSATADDWHPPFLPQLLLESLQFDGLLSDQGLELVSGGGAMHGGRYGGTMTIAWGEAVALLGDFRLEGVRLERLMPALRPAGDFEGALSGEVRLKADAGNFDGLADAMTLAGKMEIERGRFGGLDVGAIMRERGTGVVRGGATRFDSMLLDVSMSMKDHNVRAAIRRFDAGNLHVGGGVVLLPDDELSGRLTSTLSTGERSVSLPVLVSGTLGSPALRLAPEAIQ